MKIIKKSYRQGEKKIKTLRKLPRWMPPKRFNSFITRRPPGMQLKQHVTRARGVQQGGTNNNNINIKTVFYSNQHEKPFT